MVWRVLFCRRWNLIMWASAANSHCSHIFRLEAFIGRQGICKQLQHSAHALAQLQCMSMKLQLTLH